MQAFLREKEQSLNPSQGRPKREICIQSPLSHSKLAAGYAEEMKEKGELPKVTMEKRTTVLVLRMAHRIWKKTQQLPSMLHGPAVSFHILWAILSTCTVCITLFS